MSTPATVTASDVMAAIADLLAVELGTVIEGVQIEPKIVVSPTPPCLDVYPGDPFLARTSFGPGGGVEENYIVRARVVTADQVDGQELLLQMLDPRGPLSVWAALEADPTFAGTVDDSTVDSVSGFLPYDAAGGGGGYTGTLLGAEWRIRVER